VLSDHALSRALEGAGLSAPVRFEEVTRSTQETASRLAEDGAPEWTLVAASHQTEGRGRLGRTWTDEPGRALLFSLVLRPALPPELGGLLSLLAGTALVEACEETADQGAACKWPNDVLVAGAKAGGILAESRLAGDRFEFVALGVGVNLGSGPAGLPSAGAVQAEDSDLLGAFLRAFAARYVPADPAFASGVVAAYRTRCATLGSSVRARTGRGTVVEGEAVDVDETGALLVRVDGAIEAVRFGEVEHLE
jgi:BirA family transcriptional regulator, biotin operon repressor / biotin---[acetyl-CoA-carboxylase] ligase